MWRLDGLRRRFYQRHWKIQEASGWVMHRGGHGALPDIGGRPTASSRAVPHTTYADHLTFGDDARHYLRR
jgi:hypothetical protein